MTTGIVTVIPNDTDYWFMRANSGEFYPDFKLNNFIAIDGNKVLLDELSEIDRKIRQVPRALKESYKSLFKEEYKEEISNNKLTAHSVSLRSSQTYMFVEEMKIGDIVVVPSSSSMHFLIGVIISEPFEEEVTRSDFVDPEEYPECPYSKKRKIFWLKEIPREQLPNNVSGIIYSHQALLSINHLDEQINSLIALMNYYKNQLHLTLRVETAEPINSLTWLDFQRLIVDIAEGRADEIFQKKSVESPGEITLETLLENWEAIIAIYAILFGEVDYKGFRFSGLISRHFPHNRKMREAKEEAAELENHKTRADIKKTEAETEQIYRNIGKLVEKDDQTITKLESSLPSKKDMKKEPSQLEEYGSIETMELSNSEFGTEVSKKNQMDNLNF